VQTAGRLKELTDRAELPVSIGVSTYREGATTEEFLQAVNGALWQSKKAGRNRITVALSRCRRRRAGRRLSPGLQARSASGAPRLRGQR
jgi:hypothetical protein